jgi:hypothetical protein
MTIEHFEMYKRGMYNKLTKCVFLFLNITGDFVLWLLELLCFMRCVGDLRTGFGLLKWQVDCEAWLSEGDPKLVICKEAKEKRPDLLVLGSRGLGTVQR